jgi:hypothetical protein
LRRSEGKGHALGSSGVVKAPAHLEWAPSQRPDAVALGLLGGHEAGHGLLAAGDDDFTTVFDGLDQLGEMCFGFMDSDLHRAKLVLITNRFKAREVDRDVLIAIRLTEQARVKKGRAHGLQL